MGFGNVSERRSAPPQVGVSVVILALGPEGDTGNSAADSGNAANSAHSPGQARPSAVPGLLGVARR